MDSCQACDDLLAEYGTLHYVSTFISGVQRRGWAGGYSRAEKAWMDTHGPDWYQEASARAKRSKRRFIKAGKANG